MFIAWCMFDTSWYDIRWYPFCCFIFLEILWKVPETKVAVLHLRFQLLCPKAFLHVNLGEFSWRQVVWKDSQAFVLDGTALLYEEGGGVQYPRNLFCWSLLHLVQYRTIEFQSRELQILRFDLQWMKYWYTWYMHVLTIVLNSSLNTVKKIRAT